MSKHSNGNSKLNSFDERMEKRQRDEERQEAEEAQGRVAVALHDINGVKVSFGELPQVAQAIKAKRACKMVCYFTDDAPDSKENWLAIIQHFITATAYPECVYITSHIPIEPTFDNKMIGQYHKQFPPMTQIIENVCEAIVGQDFTHKIPIIQGSKHWGPQGALMVECTMIWM